MKQGNLIELFIEPKLYHAAGFGRSIWLAERRSITPKKANGRKRGSARAHSYSWSLSSPQQPLETEDSPTVSLAPKYTSQCLCRARRNQAKIVGPTFLQSFITMRLTRAEKGTRALTLKDVNFIEVAVYKFHWLARSSGTNLFFDRGGESVRVSFNLFLILTFNHYPRQRLCARVTEQ